MADRTHRPVPDVHPRISFYVGGEIKGGKYPDSRDSPVWRSCLCLLRMVLRGTTTRLTRATRPPLVKLTVVSDP